MSFGQSSCYKQSMQALPGITPITTGRVTQGQMVSVKLPAEGITQWQKNVTNYASNFQRPATIQLNQTIGGIDNQYDLLPDGPPSPSPTKQDWRDTLAALPPLPVCACSGVVMDAKKLFRMANWIPTLQGSPVNPVPPTTTGFQAWSVGTIVIASSQPPGLRYAQFAGSPGSGQGWFIANTGMGLATTQVNVFPGVSTYIAYEGTPEYAFLDSLTNTLKLSYCTFTQNFLPAGGGYCSVIHV